MGRINRYDVYDNDKLILEKATCKEIVEYLGGISISLTRYANEGLKYKQRYTFEYSDDQEKRDTLQEIIFREQWEKAIAPFKNVIWVTSGGKRLRVGGT